jgi:hypothetical protein
VKALDLFLCAFASSCDKFCSHKGTKAQRRINERQQ